MEGHNFERLKQHILLHSVADSFEVAKTEWDLLYVEISDESDNCPCGKEIREHCYIKNRLNGFETYVGNVCINRFIGISTGTLFDGLKRIIANEYANPNDALIEYAFKNGFIFEKEYGFLKSTARKRILSQKQREWKRKINHRILAKTVVKRRIHQ